MPAQMPAQMPMAQPQPFDYEELMRRMRPPVDMGDRGNDRTNSAGGYGSDGGGMMEA